VPLLTTLTPGATATTAADETLLAWRRGAPVRAITVSADNDVTAFRRGEPFVGIAQSASEAWGTQGAGTSTATATGAVRKAGTTSGLALLVITATGVTAGGRRTTGSGTGTATGLPGLAVKGGRTTGSGTSTATASATVVKVIPVTADGSRGRRNYYQRLDYPPALPEIHATTGHGVLIAIGRMPRPLHVEVEEEEWLLSLDSAYYSQRRAA